MALDPIALARNVIDNRGIRARFITGSNGELCFSVEDVTAIFDTVRGLSPTGREQLTLSANSAETTQITCRAMNIKPSRCSASDMMIMAAAIALGLLIARQLNVPIV